MRGRPFDPHRGPLPAAVLRFWLRTWWVQVLLLVALTLIQVARLDLRLRPFTSALTLLSEAVFLSALLSIVARPAVGGWRRAVWRTLAAALPLILASAVLLPVTIMVKDSGLDAETTARTSSLAPPLALALALALTGPPVARTAWPASPGVIRPFTWRLARFGAAAALALVAAPLPALLLPDIVRSTGLPISIAVPLIVPFLALSAYVGLLPLIAAPVILARAFPAPGPGARVVA